MPELGRLVTIRDVARQAKWCCEASRKPGGPKFCGCKVCVAGHVKMKRMLLAQNEQMGGLLLVNVARAGSRPIYRLTLEAFNQLRPQWFVGTEDQKDRVERLEQKVAENTEMLEMAVKAIGVLERQARALQAQLRRRVA
jgi:hypothetical protein